MDKFLCSRLACDHFKGKQHIVEFEKFAGNVLEFKTYEIQVAVFGDDFAQPPVIESVRVRLSDDEYLLLLQWQLQNPYTGFNACDGELSKIIGSIEYQVEDKIFGDNEVGTYAVYLTEIRQDTNAILRSINEKK